MSKNFFGRPRINKKPRTAICISGHMRTFIKCFPTFKNKILDTIDNYDIFLCTWDNLGISSKSGDRASSRKKMNVGMVEKILNIYQPKIYSIRDSRMNKENIQEGSYFESVGGNIRVHPGYTVSMFDMIQKCNHLKSIAESQGGFKYDYVIRLRPDLYFETRVLGFDFNISQNIKNKFYTTYFGNYGGLNDRFFFADSKTMDKIVLIRSRLKEIYNEKHTNGKRKYIFNPERYLGVHIDQSNLSIEKVRCKFHMPRLNGNRWVDQDK